MSVTLTAQALPAGSLASDRVGKRLPRTARASMGAWIAFLCSAPLSLSMLYQVDTDNPVPAVAYCVGMTLLLALSIASLERHRRRAVEAASRMTAKLHESATRYRAIVDTAADAIVIVDQSGVIRSFNAAAERIFGFGSEEAIGQSVGLLMPEPVRLAHLTLIRDYRPACGCPFIGAARTTEGRRKDGSLFPLDLSVAEWCDGNGALCFTAIMRDVTRRQQAQEALRLAKEQAELAARTEADLRRHVQAVNQDLKDANDSLHKFTAIAAHDLRAPLRRVEAFVDVLRADYGADIDEEGADILCRIERGTRRMRLMLDALLDYSKCDGSAVRGKTANIARVIDDTLEHIDLDADGVELRVDLDDVCHVRGDQVLLGHVIQNLIGNAIKFRGADKPVIRIAATRAGAAVTLAVTDNGIGIEPEFAERVFDMFCRLHDEDEYEGSGIGLSVCRKIVHDHGGRIWVDPGHVGGTRILFTLESANAAAPSGQPDAGLAAETAAPASVASTAQ